MSEDEQNWLGSMLTPPKSEIRVKCTTCKDTGFIIVGECAAICNDCSLDKLLHQHYKYAGIPTAYFKLSIKDWNVNQNYYGEDLSISDSKKKKAIGELVRKYEKAIPGIIAGLPFQIETRGRKRDVKSLHFSGGSKSGKTLLVASIAKSAVVNGVTTKCYDFSDLFAYLSEINARDKQNEIADEFDTKELIVIENLKDISGNPNSYMNMAFDRIARKRLDSEFPTIMTSDLNFANISFDTGWKSLVDECFKVKLPTH